MGEPTPHGQQVSQGSYSESNEPLRSSKLDQREEKTVQSLRQSSNMPRSRQHHYRTNNAQMRGTNISHLIMSRENESYNAATIEDNYSTGMVQPLAKVEYGEQKPRMPVKFGDSTRSIENFSQPRIKSPSETMPIS